MSYPEGVILGVSCRLWRNLGDVFGGNYPLVVGQLRLIRLGQMTVGVYGRKAIQVQ